MIWTSSSGRLRLPIVTIVLAAITSATLTSHQSAAGPVATLPVLVNVPNRGTVLVTSPAGSDKLRPSPAEGRLPTAAEPIRAFLATDFSAGPALLSEAQGLVVSYLPATGELGSLDVARERSAILMPRGLLPAGLHDLELSDRGIAVLSLFNESTTLFIVTLAQSGGARPILTKVTVPIRAVDTAFSLNGLLVLSDDQHALFEIPLGELQPNRPASAIKFNTILKDLPSPAVAVAEWRDVFYLSLGRNLLVVPRQIAASGTVTPLPGTVERTDALRVHEHYLVSLDRARGRVAISHRPVPATIRFHGDARDTAGRLLYVIELLNSYRLLPTRSIEVNRDTAFELMMAHQVLPPLPPESATDDLRKRSEAILCALNPTLCSPLRLTAGTLVRVPNIPLNEQLVTTRVTFGDRTLDEVLQDRLSPRQRLSDADLLLALLNANRALDQTLDAKLFRLAFSPWQLATDTTLRPGATLTLKDGTFTTTAQQSTCTVEVKTEPLVKDKNGLDATLSTHRAEHVRTMLSVPGQVDVALGDVELSSAAPEGLKSCFENVAGATHVVTDVIRANPVLVRVRGANAAVQYPADERLSETASYPFKIMATTRPEWSAVIQDPVVLGFRTQPLGNASVGSNDSIATVPLHDLLRRRFEALTVPVTGWEPLVFVPAAELGDGRNLRTIQSRGDPTVTISPLQRSASLATASSSTAEMQPARVVTEETRLAEGKRVRSVINYPSNPPDTSGVVIAVAENSRSVDRSHPGFRRKDGLSVWSKETEDGNGVEVETSPATPGAGPQEERDFVTQNDHGTHVAGLIAGVGLPPGLAPQAHLFLVPVEKDASAIRNRLEFAAKIPSSLVNFSQTIPTSPEAIEQILGGIDQLAHNLLVIAATANRGRELKQPSMLPISYADGLNVIGVTAADDKRQVMTSVSDFGKRYVQLLAVGQKVLGLANKGAYAWTSGASQAAPQVAGAAALLVAAGKTNPAQIKARLIATADWQQDYEDKVWGGFLNVQRAVSDLLSNVLTWRDQQNRKILSSVSFRPGEKLQLKRSTEYPPDSPTPGSTSGGEIEWSRVLRLVRQDWLSENNGDRDSYRLVYLFGDGNEVRIRKNVEFLPNQKFMPERCAPLLGNDPVAAPVGETPLAASQCETVQVEQIEDYKAKFAELTVSFKRPPQQ